MNSRMKKCDEEGENFIRLDIFRLTNYYLEYYSLISSASLIYSKFCDIKFITFNSTSSYSLNCLFSSHILYRLSFCGRTAV